MFRSLFIFREENFFILLESPPSAAGNKEKAESEWTKPKWAKTKERIEPETGTKPGPWGKSRVLCSKIVIWIVIKILFYIIIHSKLPPISFISCIPSIIRL